MKGHIRKRGKGFQVLVYIGKTTATDGKTRDAYKSATFTTRRDAENYLSRTLGYLHGGGTLPSAKVRVDVFLRDWLRIYASTLAPHTFETYRGALERYIIPEFGPLFLRQVTPLAIQSHFTSLVQKGLSPATVHQVYRVLREAFGHAVTWDLLVRSPLDAVGPPRNERKEVPSMDEEQTALFLGTARRTSPFYRLYLTAVLTGLRLGELLALKWSNVSLTLGEVTVRETFSRLGRRQLFKSPKSKQSVRTVTISPVVVEELRLLRDEQAEHKALFGEAYEDHDLVFCQVNGRPLHGHNLTQRDYRRVLKAAGLPHVKFHALRHGHVFHLEGMGVDMNTIAARLGHYDPKFTVSVYGHTSRSRDAQAARALENRLMDADNR